MKNSWQILTILLAVALVALVIKDSLFSGSEQKVEQVDPQEVVIENIMTRSSVRSYTSEPVDTKSVETLLKAGMAAPTAGNRQPWEFIVVTERETLDAIPSIIPAAGMSAKSQLAIVVCGVPSKSFAPPLDEYWVQDCSAVTQNILLAAHGMGLGAVWCGAYPDNAQGRVGKMRELLNLPESRTALCIIVIGHPDKEPVIKDKWDPAKVRYNRY